MLKSAPLAAAAGLALALLTAPAASAARFATIDCDARLNAAEKIICASQPLQILDAKITEVYAELMNERGRSRGAKADLHQSQLNFLARRNRCGANYDCLDDVMGMRATRINYYR